MMKRLGFTGVFLMMAFLVMGTETTLVFDAMPDEDTDLTAGGQFMDLLLPMEGSVAATASDWGTTAGENTQYSGTWQGTLGRWKDNGIEDTERSYWGGNIVRGDDGKYHIYVSGWPESTPRGHMAWSSASRVYHVVSDNVWGPYTYVSDIGAGHNSELYKTGDTYVIYHIEPLGIYTSATLGDTWTSGDFLYDQRDRILIAGENTETSLSNCSFAKREDGSFVMIDRGGGIWVSRDGLSDPWHQLTDASVYLTGGITNRGSLEDPVIWRDHLQYHMIVNDWRARYAYYYRSLDGLHWTKEAGKAYTGEDPFARHSDGTVEQWHKYERPRVFQDEQGRAIRMNFAVIDCVKQSDLGSDDHSSKNINMPLTPQLLLEVTSLTETSAQVKVKAETGFDPKTDLNFSTLKFGSHDKVNYGNGFSYASHVEDGDDVIITFTGVAGQSGITAGEWAPKMLGQKADGSVAFGYAQMPDIDYRPAMLSALTPTIAADGTVQTVSVSNYGQSASKAITVRVYNPAGNTLLAHGTTTTLSAYADETVSLTKDAAAAAGYTSIQVRFYDGSTLLNTENIPLTAINAAQAALQSLITEANTLYGDASLPQGKSALKTAIDAATDVKACYSITTLEAQQTALSDAINTFKYANATPTNGMSITIPNGTCDDLTEWTLTRTEADNAPGWKLNTTNRYGFDGSFIETYKSGGLKVANKACQTLSNMPAGRYRLRAKILATNNGNAATNVTFYASGATLTDSPVSQAVSTGSSTCTEYMLELTLADEGSIEFGIDFPSTTNATWVCFDSWSLKYFGTAEGKIVEEPLSFDPAKTYRIKWQTDRYSKLYWCSPKYNTAGDAIIHRTADVDEAAQFVIRSVAGNVEQFFLYDVVSHQFVVPSANATNGTAWTYSATSAGKVTVSEETGYFTLSSTAGGEANAYANDNNDGDVKNYTGGSQWLIEEAGTNTATIGIDPQAVYRLRHLNTNRNRYMAAEPDASGNLLTTNTDAEKGGYSFLPVSGREGYYYIYNAEGYFVTPSTSNWTLSRTTPAAVCMTLNIDNMETIGTSDVTFLLGESNQHANPQKDKNNVELVTAYSGHDTDRGNNWVLEPVTDARASMKAGIGPTGYTTFASLAALDLSELPEGITAYYASEVIDNTVRLLPVQSTVAAGTGLILKGQANSTVSIPVALTGEAIAGNLLVGMTAQTSLSANANHYVLVNNEGTAEFQSLASNGATIAAGKAYLNLPGSNAKQRLSLEFSGDATEIQAVEAPAAPALIYNLRGQRVTTPTRGIYIVNGQKVYVR